MNLADQLRTEMRAEIQKVTDESIRLRAENATLREALSSARPFVVAMGEHGNEWGKRARKAVAAIDAVLIATDPDPEIRAILNR